MAEKVVVSIIALLLRCAVPVTPLSIAIGRGGVINPRPATTTTTLTTRGVGGRDVDDVGVVAGGYDDIIDVFAIAGLGLLDSNRSSSSFVERV